MKSLALAPKAVVEAFHRLFYRSGATTWSDTSWLGVPLQKCPLDLWIYQEILTELRPAVIVESGTAFGGSAHFLASLCELLGHGEVVSIDVEAHPDRPSHERLTYLEGSSTDPHIVAAVKEVVDGRSPVLVILDSDHSREHVLSELHVYAPLVTTGSYLIVEDTNINGHPVLREFGPGPTEATRAFLAESSEFQIDRTKEKYFLSFNPGGYLLKTK